MTHLIGKDILPANIAIQNAEASFRDSLIRVRDQAEPMALSGNQDVGLLEYRFEEIKTALWNSMQVFFELPTFSSSLVLRFHNTFTMIYSLRINAA